MKDYILGEGLSEEESSNLVLYTEANDPNTFEESNASTKWRKRMDGEIQAIERNDT